ncbi:PadR family transcriptional regulator [Convivina intestini]|uniref:Virulence activator alpha n=1 Tax=Convivina intestini TaxID=1505726 RepID=A0A2U1DF81_9LACO|nr:PadR family transcriptional regulator [Convivina intestini]PVY86330.1 virulence activator alpha [Convivina intestini]CAH1850818.1 hypothetical protein R077811_00168 [Convivina intestini]SDB82570.1 Virulence activator alpha C-term [Leuconostocaceae bacterium R-53105]
MALKGREIILGILAGGPHTGYEINDILQNQLAHFFDGSYGMIYPTLKKLSQDGLVTSQQITQTGKPNKNIFAITPAGQTAFQKAVVMPTDDETFKSDFLMRLYFSQYLSDADIHAFIQEEIQRKEAKMARLTSQLALWQEQGMTPVQKITYDYGVAYYTSTLQVLKEALIQYPATTD